jgi:hypothetical protein
VIAALKAILNTTDLGRVRELREAIIPDPWKEAWIFLDHTPCGNVSIYLVISAAVNLLTDTRPR